MAASSSENGHSGPLSIGNKGKKRPSTDSMSSFGSPITFTARPASSDTMEDTDNTINGTDSAAILPNNENANHPLNTVDEVKESSNTQNETRKSSHSSKPTARRHSNLSNHSNHSNNSGNHGGNHGNNASISAIKVDSVVRNSHKPRTSTPLHTDPKNQRPESLSQDCAAANPQQSDAEDELNSSFSSNVSVQSTQSQTDSDILNNRIQVPIVGYEVMEERARFTVYKVAIHKGDSEKWFIFRRYNDFVHLNEQLKEIFPHFRLALPPKKWFGDNFDRDFIEDRMLGLQAFLNNIVGHRDVCSSEPVREFFCFEDPPGPHDSLEESKAMCEILEEEVYNMKRDLRERSAQINLMKEELALKNSEIDNLRKSLRIERALNSSRLKERVSPSSQSQKSESSLPEALMETDQATGTTGSSTMTSPGGPTEEPLSIAKELEDLKIANQLKDRQGTPSGGNTPPKAPSRRKDSKTSLRKDSSGKNVKSVKKVQQTAQSS